MNDNSVYERTVLLVDDEPQILKSYAMTLSYGGMPNTLTCREPEMVHAILRENQVELMILDLLMPRCGGEDLLKQVGADHPELKVVVVSGVDEVETAVRCMKKGAFDYLVKPVEGERLLTTVRRALEFRELERENLSLRQGLLNPGLQKPEAFGGMVTNHPAMHALFKYMEAIAASPRPVLITGETGVGKELAARSLHRLSGRRGEFLAANVAGLDDAVFSDTLFGHQRGAFTGADRERKGLLARAAGGTLLLDEVGDLDGQSQIKLLRLLEQGEYFPLGSDTPHTSSARIIAATNRDIDRLRQKGRFRKDLYYRLMTHHLEIPPLRRRKEDIPILLEHFLKKAARTLDKKTPTTPPELLDLLLSHSFPGNIRELESMVFDAISGHHRKIMSMEPFKRRILPARGEAAQGQAAGAEGEPSRMIFPQKLPTLKESSRSLVEEALHRSNGNISVAAGWLGISHQALRKRLKTADQSSPGSVTPKQK